VQQCSTGGAPGTGHGWCTGGGSREVDRGVDSPQCPVLECVQCSLCELWMGWRTIEGTAQGSPRPALNQPWKA
jgi:hypothetical protein